MNIAKQTKSNAHTGIETKKRNLAINQVCLIAEHFKPYIYIYIYIYIYVCVCVSVCVCYIYIYIYIYMYMYIYIYMYMCVIPMYICNKFNFLSTLFFNWTLTKVSIILKTFLEEFKTASEIRLPRDLRTTRWMMGRHSCTWLLKLRCERVHRQLHWSSTSGTHRLHPTHW